jgi:hypothetical protein
MKYYMRIFGFVTCTLFQITTLAQSDFRPGYVLQNNGDSLRGFVSYKSGGSSAKQCFFRETEKSKSTAYSADEVRGYGFLNDRSYTSSKLPASPDLPTHKVFLKVLVSGPISLYRYKKFFLIAKDSLILLPPPTEKIVETKTRRIVQKDLRYVDIINSFTDHASITANRSAYAEGDLTTLITRYNVSQGHVAAEKNLKPKVKFNTGFLAAYKTSKMEMDWGKKVSFSPSSAVVGGAFLEISSPRIYDRIFFCVEAWYENIFYQGYAEGSFSGDMVREDILIDLSYIKMPIGLKYNFFGPTNTPYVKAGLAFYFINQSTTKLIQEYEQPGNIVRTDTNSGEQYEIKNPRGFWVSVGYDKTIRKRFSLIGEFRLEKNNGFIGSSIQNFSSCTDYNFILALRF